MLHRQDISRKAQTTSIPGETGSGSPQTHIIHSQSTQVPREQSWGEGRPFTLQERVGQAGVRANGPGTRYRPNSEYGGHEAEGGHGVETGSERPEKLGVKIFSKKKGALPHREEKLRATSES